MPISAAIRNEVIRADQDPFYSLFAGDLLLPEDDLLYYRLGNELARYTELEDDLHISAVLNKRIYGVTEREVEVTPASDRPEDVAAADLIKAVVKELNFDHACEVLLGAQLTGRSLAEMRFSEAELTLESTKHTGEYFVPVAIDGKDPARLVFTRSTGRRGVLTIKGFEARQLTRQDFFYGEPLPLNKILIHSFGSKIGNPYGKGLGSKLYWMLKFKKEVLKHWLIFLDKFAQPTPYGQYEEGASKKELEVFLERITAGAWGVLPTKFKVAFLEAARSGNMDSYERFENFVNAEISKGVLGETLTTQNQSSGGSRAATEVHDKVRTQIAKADSDLLSETVQEMFIKPIIQINMPKARPPRLHRVFSEPVNQEMLIKVDTALYAMGYRLTREALIESYGDRFEERIEEPQPTDRQIDPSMDDQDQGDQDEEVQDKPIGEREAKRLLQKLKEPKDEPVNNSESNKYGAMINNVIKVEFDGEELKIGIEYAIGEIRFRGKKHARKLKKAAYGHIRGYVGEDKEALDVYVSESLIRQGGGLIEDVWAVRQLDRHGFFDELKLVVGPRTSGEAIEIYKANMPAQLFGGIYKMDADELRSYKRVKATQEPQEPRSIPEEDQDEGVLFGDSEFDFLDPSESDMSFDHFAEVWGVWFSGRRTPILVRADDRGAAISKARERKRRGGDGVASARKLKPEEKRQASGGKWLRTGPKGEKAGYNPSKKGFGPAPKAKAHTDPSYSNVDGPQPDPYETLVSQVLAIMKEEAAA